MIRFFVLLSIFISVVCCKSADGNEQEKFSRGEMYYNLARKLSFHKITPDRHKIDLLFMPIVEKFEHYYGGTVRNVSIKQVRLNDDETFAYTQNEFVKGRKTIWINMNLWEIHPEEVVREFILFHELGHAVLKRPHDESLRDDGLPNSIMFPTTDKETIVAAYADWEYYISELFRH